VPVIGANAGGLPELVRHGETGYITEVGDIRQMARHATDLLLDDSLRDAVGRKARQRVLDHFAEEAVIPQYEAYYEEVLLG
ncbi:MAG: glycosyltransferase, partial [Rhodospirillaceae bacterium]|nr:glycosyltransferase [Rhodospirillaceae bacterium]